MNERTLASIVTEASPAGTLLARFRLSTHRLLARFGVPIDQIDTELAAMNEITIGRTQSRKVLGCMNDAAFVITVLFAELPESSLEHLEDVLAKNIYSTNGYQYPVDVTRAVFGQVKP
jgi:hypothetical protein